MLTELDTGALAVYCRTWGDWRRAVDFTKEHGMAHPVYETDEKGRRVVDSKGNWVVKGMKLYPQVAVARWFVGTLSKYEHEFGLTPSGRTGIKVEKKPLANDPAAKYFGG